MSKTAGSPEPVKGLCGAKLRGQDAYCQTRLAEGAKRCRRHGGAAPQAKEKAAERVAVAKLEKEMIMLGIRDEYEPVDPSTQMLHVLAATAAEERYLAQRVADLTDPEVLTWGRSSHQEGVGPMGAVDMSTYDAVPHVLITQLRDARDRLIRYAGMCVKAGIDERRMQLAEGQAALMIGAVQRALGSVTIPGELLEQIHGAFAREFRALEGGAA
ncbi:hypothetical protein [Galactobacter valiniphilus]|uniref:hypothetical protein n=1 Tax=Galactobacter valiniphilus TaxID=2676122 RepID=UPI0037369358